MNPLWQQLADRASLTLSQQQLDRFDLYLDLLLAANQTMNLTRIDAIEEAQVGHVGDTLTLLQYLPAKPFTLADVGSGGGVPGIPLAIARPDARVTLIESTQKKATFLSDAVAKIGLENVRVIPKRGEEVARGPERESFDIVAVRAVGALNLLSEWCLPLVSVGGKLLAMKGAKIAEELPVAAHALKLLGGASAVVHPANLPGSDHHVIVEVKKIRATGKRFPRQGAQTKERPL